MPPTVLPVELYRRTVHDCRIHYRVCGKNQLTIVYKHTENMLASRAPVAILMAILLLCILYNIAYAIWIVHLKGFTASIARCLKFLVLKVVPKRLVVGTTLTRQRGPWQVTVLQVQTGCCRGLHSRSRPGLLHICQFDSEKSWSEATAR